MSSRLDLTAAGATMTPAGCAVAAAEALRTLNHHTLAAPSCVTPGWSDVGDVYRLLGELRIVAERLPQVCDQIATGLQRLGDRRWFTDDGTVEPAVEVVDGAVDALRAASWFAEDVGMSLQHAHGAVSHLYQ